VSLWAITSYFNPVRYRRRLANYRVFHQRLGAPLVTVELSFDGRFELRPGDADVLVQIHGGDVMWQKERRLNLALRSVPPDCQRIAWVDCDVLFTREDWMAQACRVLDEAALVHLFEERCDLYPDAAPGDLRTDRYATAPSMVYKIVAEGVAPENLLVSASRQRRLASNGLAWASRRDVLEAHGLYDGCILGRGDRAILCAALGRFEHCARALLMNARQEQHYLGWARPHHETVRGRIGYVPGRVLHLWHGDVANRRFGLRDQELQPFDFDPFRDIALDEPAAGAGAPTSRTSTRSCGGISSLATMTAGRRAAHLDASPLDREAGSIPGRPPERCGALPEETPPRPRKALETAPLSGLAFGTADAAPFAAPQSP